MTETTSLVELRNVRKTFKDRPVLLGIRLSLPPKQHLVLTGPSGSGKSTLLRIAAGLDHPSEGEIWISGKLASTAHSILVPPPDRGIAMVFQDLGLWPNLTAMGNVRLGLSGLQLSSREKSERARSAMADCQIESAAAEYPHRLSVGQQQRVALARAIAVRPRLLLLDEPFTALDIVLKDLLLDQLAQIARKHETSICLVSHYPSDASALQAEVAVLEDGFIREQCRPEAPNFQPQSRTLKAWQRRFRGAG